MMQFEKVIHARFVPYKSNLSQIYFFEILDRRCHFRQLKSHSKLRMYQFLPVFYTNFCFKSDIFFENLFSNTKILKIFFVEDLKRRFMSKIGILGYIQLEERFEITPYSRVPNCGIFGNRSRL